MILTADALDYTYERRIELERRDAREDGIKEGVEKGVYQIINNALKRGNTPEQVAEFNGLPLEKVLEVQEKRG